MNKEKQRIAINTILMSFLGSQELIDRWWDSQNLAFGLQTPNELWDSSQEQKVIDYILQAVSR